MFDEVRSEQLRASGSAKWEAGSMLAAGVAELDFSPPPATYRGWLDFWASEVPTMPAAFSASTRA